MDRSIQPSVMIIGCAALITTAVLLPALILRPSASVAPAAEAPKQPPLVQVTPVAPATSNVATAPSVASPVGPGAAEVAANKPAAKDESLVDADVSRGERFTIMQREAMKSLTPDELSAALPRAFAFPTIRDDAIFGVDVSHHNTDNCDCEIDWNRVAAQKVAFVYVKSSEGTRSGDSKFAAHWTKLATIPGIHRGAYHFLSADDDIEKQVDFYLKKIMPLRADDLPPAMDLEWDIYPNGRKFTPVDKRDYWANLDSEEIIARALKWLELVEQKTGRTPVIYTAREWWRERIGDDSKFERFKRYPLWLSAMSDKNLQLENPNAGRTASGAWGGWDMWQFTKMGDLSRAGVKLPSDPKADRWDVSIVPGTLEDFQKKMGIAPIVVASNDPSPKSNGSGGGDQPKDAAKNNDVSDPQKAATSETQNDVGKPSDAGTGKEASTTPAKKRRPTRTPKSPAASEPQTSASTANDRNPETDNTGKPGEPGLLVPQEPAKDKQLADATPPQEPAKDGQASTAATEPAKDKQADATPPQEPAKDGQASTAATEPAKDKQADATPPQEPAKDNQASPATTKEAQADPPKDSSKDPQPNAPDADKPKAADAAPAAAGGATVAATEPAKTPSPDPATASAPVKEAPAPSTSLPSEPPKETRIIRMPSADGAAGTSAEPNAGANPGAAGTAASSDPPQEPKAAAASDAPAKPETPVAPSPPSTGVAVASNEPAKEPPAPAASNDANKPADPPAPAASSDANKPANPPAPAVSNDANKPADPPTISSAATPSDAPKDAKTSTSGGNIVVAAKPETPSAPSSDTKTESKPATAAADANTGTSTDPQKPMMEIVLKNGRVLRVETDTDPDKLLRLIALLEQQ